VKNDAILGEKKTMHFPGAILDLPTLTEQDHSDLLDFGIKKGIDMVAASFVRKSEDIDNIREVLGEKA
jgi:pyruvate kinase